MTRQRQATKPENRANPQTRSVGPVFLYETIRHPWIPRDLLVPPPWAVNMGGIWETVESHTGAKKATAMRTVAERPVIPIGLVSHEDGNSLGEMRVVLAYVSTDRKKWHIVVPGRDEIADHNALKRLAAVDLPVTGQNAKALSSFLSVELNGGRLPWYKLLHHMGWTPEGYALGDVLIGETKDFPIWIAGSSQVPPRGTIYVYDADVRDAWARQIPDALRPQGTLHGWIAAVATCKDFPLALFALYAGVVSLIQPWLPAPNFVVQYTGMTSTGKTSALRLAASEYGYPDQSRSDGGPGLVFSDMTKAGAEGAAAGLTTLPLLVDDFHRIWARSPEIAQSIIYMVAGGSGKVRAAPWGMARHHTFRTVMLISSEQDITQNRAFGGVGARTITINRPPFGEPNPTTDTMLKTLHQELQRHHGHVAREIARAILVKKPNIPAMYEVWLKRVENMSKQWLGSVESRRLQYMAAIGVAGEILHRYIPLPWPAHAVAESIRAVIADENAQENPSDARNVLDRIQMKLRARPASFIRAGQSVDQLKEWSGIEYPGKMVVVLPHVLERYILEEGLDPAAYVREWAQRGWLRTANEGGKLRYTLKVQYGRHRFRGYVLEWTAWSARHPDLSTHSGLSDDGSPTKAPHSQAATGCN